MSEELMQAISVGNNYFALADGLAVGLENHLAEDVLLDFFGQTIRGRQNVAAFIQCQKITRHDFEEIVPKASIGYRENRSLRRKYQSTGGASDNNNLTSPDPCEFKYKRKCFSDAHMRISQNLDDSFLDSSSPESHLNSTRELCSTKIEPEVDECFIEKELNIGGLHLDPFSTPHLGLSHDHNDSGTSLTPPEVEMSFSPEPTLIEDVEMHISQLKSRAIVKNDSEMKTSLKFLEANGAVEFSKVFSVKQVRKDTKKRQCRLQIAYSIKDENFNVKTANSLEKPAADFSEIMEEDNEDERNEFLQTLELQFREGGNINNLMTPKYVRGQLKFDKSKKLEVPSDFVCNYQIQVIIYGASTKCRLNLSHEFEGKEYFENDA